MINQYLLERSQFEQALQQIQSNLQWGLIDEVEADKRLMELTYDYGFDFSAEDWEDIDWDEDGLPHKDSWTEEVEWDAESTYQSAKALKFLLSLSRGRGSTELESTFLLSPVFLQQLLARVSDIATFTNITSLEGFGEGPYQVSLSIVSLNEILAQTELQLHTIFEAYEEIMEGAPSEEGHDHDDDDDEHEHDEFESAIEHYLPYRPPLYRILVDVGTEIEIRGTFEDVGLAQQEMDDWNAPGDELVASIEKLPHINGAYRGHSRVIFEDGSYLTFVLMGDIIHRDGQYVDISSIFIYPRAFAPTSAWWDEYIARIK